MHCDGIVRVTMRIYRSDFVFFDSLRPQFEKLMTRDYKR